jgi:ABC-type glycerol-3-phosphate transport system substrate-binding protein
MAAQARRRALTAILATLALTGCGASKDEGISGGGKVIGRTVTVYSLTSDPGGSNRDFVDAEKLALADAGGRAGSLAVNFTSLDLGGSDEKLQAQAARRAINDPQIIAAIVDATKVTVPLFNAAGILQVATSGDPSLASDPQALPSGKHTVATVPPEAPPADFEARFAKEFGHDPAPSAATGYRAMAGVLKAIAAAGAAGNDRTRVIDAYIN